MKKINLIPMAGEGQRFKDAGYTMPKPLIDVDGMPMVIRAAKSLPIPDQWIFICRLEHIKDYNIDKIILKYYPDANIISISEPTGGQASTCLLAKDYFSHNDMLTIGACDNGMYYDTIKLNSHLRNSDALIWTFKGNPTVLKNPNMYGWVSINELNFVEKVSCKMPISNQPLDDHAVVGTFTFKKASYFLDCAESMISKNRRINNEFYLDIVLDECVQSGLKVSPFEVKDYICWGTPSDLKKYKYFKKK